MLFPKVSIPNAIAHLKWTLIFQWCVIRCGSRNKHQTYMCIQELGLHASHLFTILGSIVNIIGRHIRSFSKKENLHFDYEKNVHMSSNIYDGYGYGHDLDLLIIVH